MRQPRSNKTGGGNQPSSDNAHLLRGGTAELGLSPVDPNEYFDRRLVAAAALLDRSGKDGLIRGSGHSSSGSGHNSNSSSSSNSGFASCPQLQAICASLDRTKRARGCGKSTYLLLIPSVRFAVSTAELGRTPTNISAGAVWPRLQLLLCRSGGGGLICLGRGRCGHLAVHSLQAVVREGEGSNERGS